MDRRDLNPLILAGWGVSPDQSKLERFRAQIQYATRVGLGDEAERFVSDLREEDWHTCLAGDIDKKWWDANLVRSTER